MEQWGNIVMRQSRVRNISERSIRAIGDLHASIFAFAPQCVLSFAIGIVEYRSHAVRAALDPWTREPIVGACNFVGHAVHDFRRSRQTPLRIEREVHMVFALGKQDGAIPRVERGRWLHQRSTVIERVEILRRIRRYLVLKHTAMGARPRTVARARSSCTNPIKAAIDIIRAHAVSTASEEGKH